MEKKRLKRRPDSVQSEIDYHMGDMKKRRQKIRTPSPNIGVKG
jgi:hypothetical protein|tara:strand:- start:2135 stop:2263 length:129 start_codon:yes stop_codon:yes gene_type:complete